MPRDRRRTSRSASSSDSKGQKRVPPSAGPRAVEWIATIAFRPVGGSWKNTTSSYSASSSSKTDTRLYIQHASAGRLSGPSGAEPIMRAVIPCAYLRVFRPLETFPPEERAQWERFILEGGAPASRRPVYREEALMKEGHVGLLASAEG